MTKRFCTHCKVLLLGFLKMLQSRIVLTAFPQRFTLKFNSRKTAGFLACLEDKCYLIRINNVILFERPFLNYTIRLQNIAWKVSKYGVFSGPHFPVFGLNNRKIRTRKKLHIWTPFTQWKTYQMYHTVNALFPNFKVLSCKLKKYW